MKRLLSIVLVFALAITCCPITSYAASDEAEEAAWALYELGLFSGTGTNPDGTPNFDLDRVPTRAEGITMLVKLLGKEQEAMSKDWDTPFTDVPAWAEHYVGYAYTNHLTSGTSATTFGTNVLVSATQYISFVLQSLGYVIGEDFQWDKAWELSDQIGLTKGEYSDPKADFTRGDVAIISYRSLSVSDYIAVSGIELSQKSASLSVGESVTITATVSPADATDKGVTWSSSDATVATVSGGKITALATGTAVITAKCGAKEATCTVSVTPKAISYSGTGDKVISNVNIPSGLYYAEYTYSGTGHVLARLFYGSDNSDYILCANNVGRSSGQVSMDRVSGAAITDGMLEIRADGDWTIRFVPIFGTTTTNISGRGEIVTGIFTAEKTRYVVTSTHDGEDHFLARVIQCNTTRSRYELAANEVGNYSGQRVVELDAGEQYYIVVKADGNWTLDFGEGDSLTKYELPEIPTPSADSGTNNGKTDGDDRDDSRYPGGSDYTGDNDRDDDTGRNDRDDPVNNGHDDDWNNNDDWTTGDDPNDNGSDTSSGTGNTPPQPTLGGIDALVAYIDAYGGVNKGYHYIQTSRSTSGRRIVASITHRDDVGLLIFHCNIDDKYYVSFDYSIASQSAASQITVNGVGGSTFNTCKAYFDISSYTSSTNLDFAKDDNPFASFPDNYAEEANLLVQIAVPSWGVLLTSSGIGTLNDIGFSNYN